LVLYLTILGVILTTMGAIFIGWNDVMSEDEALRLGQMRASGETREQNLTLPAVQELLKRSKNSKRGLSFVLLGAVFLILASSF